MYLQLKNIRLRFAQVSDAAFILELRTHSVLSQHLNKTDNNIAQQEAWLQQYKVREAAGAEYYFIIENDEVGERIGTVRIYNIQGLQYTSGSWIIKPGVPEEAAFLSDYMVTRFAFLTLGFQQCYFDVRKDNRKVLFFHKRFANVVNEDAENTYLIMDQEGFKKKKRFFEQVLSITAAEEQKMVVNE